MSEPNLFSLFWSLTKRYPKEAKLLVIAVYFAFFLGIALYVPCHDATMGGDTLPWIEYRYLFGEYGRLCQVDISRIVLEAVGLTAALGIVFVVLKLTEVKD